MRPRISLYLYLYFIFRENITIRGRGVNINASSNYLNLAKYFFLVLIYLSDRWEQIWISTYFFICENITIWELGDGDINACSNFINLEKYLFVPGVYPFFWCVVTYMLPKKCFFSISMRFLINWNGGRGNINVCSYYIDIARSIFVAFFYLFNM